MVLYDHPLSGNCHKIRLLLSMLALPYESRFTDVINHATKTEEFGTLNPLRQIPILMDGDYVVQDSHAVLVYLAEKYGAEWSGVDAPERARVMEWLSFSANEIGNSLQPARVYYLLDEMIDIERATNSGLRVLKVLDERLAMRDWLALDRPTIADLACFPYVALSREGRLPLDDFANVCGWIERVMALPGFIEMPGIAKSAAENYQHP
ncbi:glutathione S-transferase family protein [Cupriavidus lacunae]|nr:glutathione S-transferase N-terminal domain-containing protein [Cupriavidus lacunae]